MNLIPTISRPHPNMTLVHFPSLTILYSYETPVAFLGSQGYVRSINYWSATTGKHLNRFVSKEDSIEVDADMFEELLNAELLSHSLGVKA